MQNYNKCVITNVSQNHRNHTGNSLHSCFCDMHELLWNWGAQGNYIFITLICSSNLFKVIIKITFLPPEAKRTPETCFWSFSLASVLLSFLPRFLLVMLISWLRETIEAFSGIWELILCQGMKNGQPHKQGHWLAQRKKVCEEEKKHHVKRDRNK